MRNEKEAVIGPLKCFVYEGRPGGPAVVLFHGYGADAGDLLPLADMMGLSKDVTWVFPNAPLEIIIAPGFYGRAWFQIDSRRLEQAMAHGEPLDMSDREPDGLGSARKQASEFYRTLRAKHSKVVLGGFSQGAMLATELALTETEKPAGLVIMSGTLIAKKRWTELLAKSASVPYIQTHGKNDALLGFEFAENLHNLLEASDWHGEFVAFSGGHEIPPTTIQKIGGFLKGIVR